MGPRSLLFPPAAPSGWSQEPDFRSSPDVQGRCRKVEQMGLEIPEGAERRRTAAGGCAWARARAEVGSNMCHGMCHRVCPGYGTGAEGRLGWVALGAFPVPTTKICPELPLAMARPQGYNLAAVCYARIQK